APVDFVLGLVLFAEGHRGDPGARLCLCIQIGGRPWVDLSSHLTLLVRRPVGRDRYLPACTVEQDSTKVQDDSAHAPCSKFLSVSGHSSSAPATKANRVAIGSESTNDLTAPTHRIPRGDEKR